MKNETFLREKSIEKSLREEKKVTSRTSPCFYSENVYIHTLKWIICEFCHACVNLKFSVYVYDEKNSKFMQNIFPFSLVRSYQSLSHKRENFCFLFSLSSLNFDLINELTCTKCSLNSIFKRLGMRRGIGGRKNVEGIYKLQLCLIFIVQSDIVR